MGRAAKVMLSVLAALAAIQLVPGARTNPPVEGDLIAPDAVRSVVRRACYDCHSNETTWPWYGRVAPVSWLVVRDVKRGRRHLNFSAWTDYTSDPETGKKKLRQIAKEVSGGDMPLWYYLPLHPEARLTADERTLVTSWARGEAARIRVEE